MPNVKDSFSAYEDVIIKDIKKLVKKHEKRLAAEFGFDDLTNAKQKKDWGDRVEKLHKAMDGADANGVKFVQIYPYSNTIKKTN